MADRFDKIVILGTGKLFLDCLSYVAQQSLPYEGYETSGKVSKLTRLQAEKKGIHYEVEEKEKTFQRLLSDKDEILLISAINPVILPDSILKRENIGALNCHQALLPRYKGRNAECWAIYKGETEAGITWHKMTGKVDGGDILCIKRLPITGESTACGLFRQQIDAAYEAFTEFMHSVLAGKETYTPQSREEKTEFHYSWEIPEQGILDVHWSGEKISRFLRATDYGVLKVMPCPTVILEGTEYRFKKYEICRLAEVQEDFLEADQEKITMIRQDYKFTLSRLEIVKNGR